MIGLCCVGRPFLLAGRLSTSSACRFDSSVQCRSTVSSENLFNPLVPTQRELEGLCCLGGARPPGFSDSDLIGPLKEPEGNGRDGDSEQARSLASHTLPAGPSRALLIGERNPVYVFQRIIMKMATWHGP